MSPSLLPIDLLPHVVSLAEECGQMLAHEFSREGGPRGGGSHADIDDEIEAKIRDRLLTLFPARWLGEETGSREGPGGSFCWLVDPHDGTSDYLSGARGSSVSIALLRNGVPVIGVVHSPTSPDRGSDTIAWAEGATNVTRNGVALRRLRDPLFGGNIVFVSHAAADWPVSNAQIVAPARFVSMPSIAYRLARVAAGDGIAGVSLSGAYGWDYAAGHALLIGAGGVLLDQDGRPVTYTVDGNSSTKWCFGGSQKAAAAISRRNWSTVRDGGKIPKRIVVEGHRRLEDISMDRAVGCLLGQVAGDSLGSLVEFRSPHDIAVSYPNGVRELDDGGTWSTIAGQPTDDSELALDLARTLALQPEWSSEAVAEAYAGWYGSKPFDIGGTTRQAFSAASKEPHGSKAEAARRAASLSSQANGALMRCSPIGLWARSAEEAAYAAREDAALSHPHPVCRAASAAFCAAIFTAVAGGDRDAMLSAADNAIQEDEAEAVRVCLSLARAGIGPDDFMAMQGWVLVAFQNAFRHLAVRSSLEQALIETVGCGGDTDTNGAICGALLGASQGRLAIPTRWTIPILACRPMKELRVRQARPSRYWPDDLPLLAEALLARKSSIV